MSFSTVFKESTGEWSMRRVLAFLFALAAIALAAVALVLKMEWKAVAAAAGIPVFACIVLLLFTTWNDVTGVVSAIKGGKN